MAVNEDSETNGKTFTYTGNKCDGWTGHIEGDNHTVAGNMLVGSEVVEETSKAFETAEGPFEERLLIAMEAGEIAGGDKRGDNLSAALLVHAPESKLYHNLRVDKPGTPIDDLLEAYEVARETEQEDNEAQLRESWGEDYPDQVLISQFVTE